MYFILVTLAIKTHSTVNSPHSQQKHVVFLLIFASFYYTQLTKVAAEIPHIVQQSEKLIFMKTLKQIMCVRFYSSKSGEICKKDYGNGNIGEERLI